MFRRLLYCPKPKRLFSFQSINYKFQNTQIHKFPSYTTTTLPQRIVQKAPEPIKPYLILLRIDKPIGTYLLMYPCLWSLGIASKLPFPDPWLLFLFVTGSFIMRGAGCVINDLWDRKIDNRVERTKSRPIASGQVKPFQALVFLGANLLAGLCILLQLNTYSIILGASSLGLVVTYPLMKRITYWPQFFLGLTFNWGALVGYSAVLGYCEWSVALPLYAAGIAWTLVYDTIYAHQDKVDDKIVGVKSTALLFGDKSKQYLTVFATIFGTMLCVTGVMAGYTLQQWPFYLGVGVTTAHLLHMILTVNYSNPKECMQKFVATKWGGLIVFLSILFANILYTGEKRQRQDNQTVREKLQTLMKYFTNSK